MTQFVIFCVNSLPLQPPLNTRFYLLCVVVSTHIHPIVMPPCLFLHCFHSSNPHKLPYSSPYSLSLHPPIELAISGCVQRKGSPSTSARFSIMQASTIRSDGIVSCSTPFTLIVLEKMMFKALFFMCISWLVFVFDAAILVPILVLVKRKG